MAYKIMLFPLQSMTFVTSRALFPVMSRQQNSIEDMAALYLRAVSFVVFFTAPLMAGIFVLRAPFILYCFGSQWGQVSNILIWLAPVGFLQSIVSTTGTVFMARGRTDVLLKLGTLGTVLQVSAFIIGVRWGVIGVAICYFISNVLNAFPALIVTMRQLNSSITVLGKNLMASILNAGLMACGVYGLSIFTPNTLLGFAELIFAGVILYVVLAILFQQSNCKSLLRVLKPGIS
jgi:PST family polysaccharide transporter